MNKIITYNFSDDFIKCLSDYIIDNYYKKGKPLNKVAIVFGGKRPSLFLKQELARRINKSYFPPQFFSIDEFIHYILKKDGDYKKLSDLDSSYIVYKLASKCAPNILNNFNSFSMFLPWAREISGFIDELDLEDISNNDLINVQNNAEIGYEVPANINELLKKIVSVRDAYHRVQEERRSYTRGNRYLKASNIIEGKEFDDFSEVIFCNVFYLHNTEKKIVKRFYDKGKAVLLLQKDNNNWPVLDNLAETFNCKIESKNSTKRSNINIYKGFDIHSQVGIAREVLSNIKNPQKTVIVLPESETLIPLLSEISSIVSEFNVSLGYPLKRSSIFSLFKSIFKAQTTKKSGKYYTKDYLKVLLHPLIKNMAIREDPAVTRVLMHKLEEVLLGIEETDLGGSLFVNLSNIEETEDIYKLTSEKLKQMDINIKPGDLCEVLSDIHKYAFGIWEGIHNFSDFGSVLNSFLEMLIKKSVVGKYPFNIKVLERIYGIGEEVQTAEFVNETFEKEDIFKIFNNKLKREIISFKGSPLKGLQILGFLETRVLSFENVIILDTNEAVLPRLKSGGRIIPGQVMADLGLKRIDIGEEIQKYHFMRLIGSAQNIHLIYNDSSEKQRSRFIEEIVWEGQKEKKSLFAIEEKSGRFDLEVLTPKPKVKKSPEAIKYLEGHTYSPSSIDTYLHCPLQFYYQYVLGLKEKGELLDEPESKDIGNFIHKLLEDSYRGFIGKEFIIDETFKKNFFKMFDSYFKQHLEKKMGSDAFILKDIMKSRLNKYLENEEKREVRKVLSLEDDALGGVIKLAGRGIKFTCRIDRIDLLQNDSILIIDYKTGTTAKIPAGLKGLETLQMDRESIKEKVHSFQLPLYYYFTSNKYKDKVLNAALYGLQQIDLKSFIKSKDIANAGSIMDKCFEALSFIISEILDPDKDFEADTSNERICQYCPFINLCR